MSYERCKYCRFWTKERDNVGRCENENFIYQGCLVTEEKEKEDPNAYLFYWDYGCYEAGFETGKDFGCIHWEDRYETNTR